MRTSWDIEVLFLQVLKIPLIYIIIEIENKGKEISKMKKSEIKEIIKNIAGQVIVYILGLAATAAVVIGCLIYALSWKKFLSVQIMKNKLYI